MTATDELRALLDERDRYYVSDSTVNGFELTAWRDGDYREVRAIDFGDGKLRFDGYLTPAQAVEATLGRTCRIIEDEDIGMLICSECGAVQPEDYTAYYCWSCGAKVVDE